MKKSFLGSLVLLLIFTSCSKYPDGPAFSLLTKKERLCNDWVLVEREINGDIFEEGSVKTKMSIEKDGSYSISSTINQLGQLQGEHEHGMWKFDDTKKLLYLYNKDASGSNENNDPDRTYTIMELRNKKLRLKESFPAEIIYSYEQE